MHLSFLSVILWCIPYYTIHYYQCYTLMHTILNYTYLFSVLYFDRIPLYGVFILVVGLSVVVGVLVRIFLVPWFRNRVHGKVLICYQFFKYYFEVSHQINSDNLVKINFKIVIQHKETQVLKHFCFRLYIIIVSLNKKRFEFIIMQFTSNF